MKKKILCLTCKHLGMSYLDGFKWQVCKHQAVYDTFSDGRALDFDDEPNPDWCPILERAPKIVSKNSEEIERKDISFYSKRNEVTNACTVWVTHKPTGLQAKANEYENLMQNRNLALSRLKEMLNKTSFCLKIV